MASRNHMDYSPPIRTAIKVEFSDYSRPAVHLERSSVLTATAERIGSFFRGLALTSLFVTWHRGTPFFYFTGNNLTKGLSYLLPAIHI